MSSSLEQHEHSARLARALVALEKMQSKLEASEREKREPIAITGMGCRFPGGGNDPAAFWALLREGRDTIVEVPPDRWDIEAYYDPDPDAPGKMYTRWGGFLQDVRLDELDARFFGIAPREVASMDPQQRLMLEVAWEALANAGQAPERLANSLTGVFFGVMLNDYVQLQMQQRDPALLDAYLAFGNDFSFMAGRLSYLLGAQGPSMAISTACSSSLVSVHLACQALRARECNMALAGGVSVILAPDGHIVSSRIRSQSPNGRCKTFDAAADGYVRGEGCGVVVLKRLSDAIAGGDPVLAVIRGSAVNHDGPSGGLTVPSGPAQEAVVRRALANAGVAPGQVSYVEAHGTGTPLGDPIEVRALQRVFGEGRSLSQKLSLGSVKTNIGHLEAAAGIAGLIKVVLMLQHGEIPPHLHLTKPTPALPWDELPITIPTRLKAWSTEPGKRMAGVSSFGLSGINAHLLVEEAPEQASRRSGNSSSRPAYLLPLSARSKEALHQLARAHQAFLADGGPGAGLRLEDICYTASARRSHYEHRLTAVGRTREALADHLGAFLRGETLPAVSYREASLRRPKVVFVFSGQGAQWPAMGRELLRVSPVFRSALEACDRALRAYVDWSLLELLCADEPSSRMADIDVLQPTLFALAVALSAEWRSYGVEPDAVVGHSMGEVAAACVAGVLSLEDAARVICRRSALLRRIRGKGAMALAEISFSQAQAALKSYEDRLSIAASNSPTSTVLAGDPGALSEVMASLQRQNIFCRSIKVDVASHCPQVEPLLPDLLRALEGVRPKAASLPVYSTVTGKATDGTDWGALYWQRNLRDPVLFSTAIQELLSSQHHIFLELSPHPILLQAVERTFRAAGQTGIVLPTLRREEGEVEVLLQSLGALHTAGVSIDWQLYYPEPGKCVLLPSYPWQRERFWLDSGQGALCPATAPVVPPAARRVDEERLGAPAHASDPAGADGTPARFYDDSVQQELVLKPDEVYLTFGILRQRVQGFSWLMSVYGLSERQEHTEVLLDAQRALRSVLFRGIRWSSVRKALDFGCGYASDLISLSRRFPHLTLHGYTISAEQAAIDEARVKSRGLENRIRVFARDSAKDDFPDRYDVIFGLEVATHIADKAALFSNISRSLQNGGFVLLADFIAHTASSIDVRETASYNSHVEEWVDLLSRHHLRLVESVDISREAANFLEDPEFDRHVGLVSQRFKLSELIRRNFDAMRNFGKALEKGLMSYALLIAQKDEYAGRSYISRVNRAKLGALTPLAAFEDGGAWAAPSEDAEILAPLALREWVYEVAWPEKARAPRREGERRGEVSGPWLILSDRTGVGDALAAQLQAQGERCTVVYAGAGDEALGVRQHRVDPADPAGWQRFFEQAAGDEGGSYRRVVHLWSLDSGAGSAPSGAAPDEALRLGCGSLLLLMQRLARGASQKARLWVVTRGAQAVGGGSVSTAQAPLWGVGRVLALEHPELWGGLLDLSPNVGEDDIQALWDELWEPDGEDQIAYRGRKRHVARLVRSDAERMGEITWREDGAYLITGGLGGLGLQVARWLVAQGVRHVILVGRAGLPDQSQWDDLPGDGRVGQQIAAVRALQALGADVQIVRCDVGEPAQVTSLIEQVRRGPTPLLGIFHAAGVPAHRAWLDNDLALLSSVFRPKALGAWMMHELTRDMPLDCFVLFSSAASLWGSQGMAAYAAANHFLDALAHHRRALGLAATSINWGRWSGGGMASSEQAQQFFSQVGLEGMPSEAALSILGRLIGAGVAQRAVVAMDWGRFKPIYEARRRRPFLELIATAQPVAKGPAEDARSELLLRLEEAPTGRRRALLLEHVRGEVAHVLGAEPSSLEPQHGFFQMGMNSLMSVELKGRLEKSLRRELPSTLAFEYPTVESLTDFLAKEVPALKALIPASVDGAGLDSAMGDSAILELLGEAERLSEDELLQLADSFGEGDRERGSTTYVEKSAYE